MSNKLENVLNYKLDNNYKLFQENYNENILSDNAFYNLILKNYKNNIKNKNELMKFFNIDLENKKTDNKKISIIIPTYNRKYQLKECIDSILRQTYNNYEILVIDDCSKDNTEEFLKENYNDDRIIYIKNTINSGAGFSRKNGYNNSTGDYIIFCDDDDYYIDDGYFNNVVKIFEDEDISLIVSNSYVHYEKENKYVFNKLNYKGILPVEKLLENFQFKYMKPNSTFTTVFRKSILEKSEMKNMKMVNDSSIYLRGLISGKKVFVNENIIGIYRIHSKNITFNIKADFLIENLDEKKYIYKKIKEEKLLKDADYWFEQQVILTVGYFFSGTNPKKTEKDKIYKWIKNNIEFKSNIYLKLKIIEYKVIVKKIVKKVLLKK